MGTEVTQLLIQRGDDTPHNWRNMIKKFFLICCSDCNIPAQVFTSDHGTGVFISCPLCDKTRALYKSGMVVGEGMGFLYKSSLFKDKKYEV